MSKDYLDILNKNFEKFIRSIAFEFAQKNFDDYDVLIKKHLASICDFIGMKRAFIVLYDHKRRESQVIYEYLGNEIQIKRKLFGIVSSYDNETLFTKTLLSGNVIRIQQISEIPISCVADILYMKSLGLLSYFAIPIFFEGNVIGSVEFGAEIPDLRELTLQELDSELDLVDTFAKILSGYLSRQKIQEDLAMDQNLLNSIMESSATAIVVLETSGKIIYANPISESILGISHGDIVNRSYNAPQWKSTTIDGEPWTEKDQPFTIVLTTKKPVSDIRHAIEDHYGKKKYLSINGFPLLDSLGEVSRVVFLVTDITENVLKDKSLLESEFRYRTIAESSLSLVYDLDLRTNEISWAGAITEITGYSLEEYEKVNLERWIEFIHPEDRQLVENTLRNTINEREKFSLEYRYQKQNGSYLHIEDQGQILCDKRGIPYRMLGAMIDRTERYNALIELKNQEETLRLALQSAEMGIWIWDIKKELITWSSRVFEIFKISEESFSGKFEDMVSLTHPEDKESMLNNINRFISMDNQSNDYYFQHRVLCEGGEISYVEGTGKLFREKDGKPSKIIGTISDITERKRSENALKQSEQRFQTFYHFSNEAIIIFKVNKLEIVDINQAFLSLFCLEKNELGNHTLKKMMSSKTFSSLRKMIQKEIDTEKIDVILTKKGMIPFPAQVIARRYTENDENMIALNIIDTSAFKEVIELRQINEEINMRNRVIEHQKIELQFALDHLKKTQSQLVQSEKMAILGQLVAGVAHEINNPIGAIKASNQNLEKWGIRFKEVYEEVKSTYYILSEKQKKLFNELLEKVSHSTEFFTGMQERKLKKSNLSKLESSNYINENRFEIAERWVDIGIGEIDIKYKELFENKKINLILDYFNLESIYNRNTRTINTAIDRVSKIIYALKNFSHFERHGKKERVSVVDSLDVVFTIYQNQLKKGIDLIKDYEEIPYIECYPDDLLHIWTNLIYNSFQAMDFKGTITIRIRNHENEISVSIKDSGPGIPIEIQDQIFDPFFTTKKIGEGSGLGLDIVKKIVDKHNGKIELNSRPGNTEFVVFLPK